MPSSMREHYMILRLVIVVLWQVATFATAPVALGQLPNTPDDLSATLAAILKRHDIPGMAAIVTCDSRTLASGVVGVRRRGDTVAITINDRFHIGSETKAMTATLCARLIEVGKLKWDISLAEVFPELSDSMLPPYREITLAQLLTQRSGIRETIESGDWNYLVAFEGTPTAARRRWLERVVRQELDAPTGSHFIYSNTNYIIAGHVIETIMCRSFEELLRTELFVPLGMSSAGFGAPGTTAVVDEPRGHTAAGRVVEPSAKADNPQVFAPSGTVHCSLVDWAKFANLHATLGESHPQLLQRSAYDMLHGPILAAEEPKLQEVAPASVGYAMGWFVFPKRLLAHTGTNLSWFANGVVVPHAKLSVLVACNQGGDKAETACHEALQSIVNDYYRKAGAAEPRSAASENR